jgi:hypothetical protein
MSSMLIIPQGGISGSNPLPATISKKVFFNFIKVRLFFWTSDKHEKVSMLHLMD